MKAFLIGFLFLVFGAGLVILGLLFYPFLLFIAGLILIFLILILDIWLLGKFIIAFWKLFQKDESYQKLVSSTGKVISRFENKKAAIIISILIISAGLFCYSNSLGGDFIWDDSSLVVENHSITSFKYITSSFFNPYSLAAEPSQALDNYRPLVNISYMTDHFFWGLDPFGYHLTNLILHILNGILLYFLMLYLVKNDLMAAIIALIFTVHPVQVESVTWISSRTNVQFMLFYLLSLLFYFKFRQGKQSGFSFYYLSLFCFTLSIFSKEMALSLPFIIILHDLILEGKYRLRFKVKALSWIPFFLILLFFITVRTLAIHKIAPCAYLCGNFYRTFFTMLKGVMYYLKLIFWPQKLCADYLLPASASFLDLQVFSSALILVIIALLIILLMKHYKKTESFFILWFFITLLPVANIIPIKVLVAERFLYLPAIGIIAFSVLVTAKLIKNKIILTLFMSVIIILLSVRTVFRNNDWQNEISFFKSGVAFCPQNARLHLNLGGALTKAGIFDEAELEYKEALRLNPYMANVYIGLGKVYVNTGKQKEVRQLLQEGLEKAGDDLKLLNSLGVFLSQVGDYQEALKTFDKILSIDPSFINAYFNKGMVLEEEGKYREAIWVYAEIMEATFSRFDRAMSLVRIGELYSKLGEKSLEESTWQMILKNYSDQEAVIKLVKEKINLPKEVPLKNKE